MASTNKTTNYELSQFLGTDKPAWLSDYNTDMSKIDTAIKDADDAAVAAGGTADAATTAIGTLNNLTTDAKTNVVAAINEVDSHADGAQNTASSALSTATSASTNVTNLANYFNLNSYTTYNSSNLTIVSGGGTIRNASTLTVARNADGSLAKIYGYIIIDNPTSTPARIKLNANTGLSTDSKITVTGTGFIENIPTDYGLTNLNIDINTDGTIEFYGAVSSYDNVAIIRCLACIIFVKNFGDQPE